jgi:branched-chain amino acid transport system permease protein
MNESRLRAPRHYDVSTLLILCGIVILVALLASTLSVSSQRVVTEALIKLVVVVGMFIFSGSSGVLSFGHVSFMALGGYMSAILTLPVQRKEVVLDLPVFLEQVQVSPLTSMAVSSFFAALVALIVAPALMRLRGIALPMATFALLAITHVVAANWTAVTNGRQALVGLPRFTDLPVATGASVLAIVVAFLYQNSRRGLLLRTSREDEVASAATGVSIARERLIAFVVSAFFIGLGGVLFSHFVGTVTANTFYLDLTFVTISMLVVGGMFSLTGAVLGVAVVSTVSEVLRIVEKGIDVGGVTIGAPPGLQELVLAVIMGAILMYRPIGLAGRGELSWRGFSAVWRRPSRQRVEPRGKNNSIA